MGMAASQARYLALVARKSNCEYEGQQINQARTVLSNQSANLFNQMLGLSVPVPPSTQDYTKTQYSFSDGINEATIDTWKQLATPEEEYNYVIGYHYYADVYTGSQKKMNDPQVQFAQGSSSSIDEIETALRLVTQTKQDYEDAKAATIAKKNEAASLLSYVDNSVYTNIYKSSYDVEQDAYTFYQRIPETWEYNDTSYDVYRDSNGNKYYLFSDNKYYSLDGQNTEYTGTETLTRSLIDNISASFIGFNSLTDDAQKQLVTDAIAQWNKMGVTAKDVTKTEDMADIYFNPDDGTIAFKSDLRNLNGSASGGTKTVCSAYHTGAETEAGSIANIAAKYDAQIATLEAAEFTAQQAYETATMAYESLSRPTYIGNCELTLLTDLTTDEKAELLQVVKDMEAQNVNASINNCFNDNGDYLGGVYKFTLNGVTYYTSYADLIESYNSGTGINHIDGQSKLAYYNATYVSTKIEKTDKALLETDGSGRFTSVRIGDDTVTYKLSLETVTDDAAYKDAMNQYYYDNAKYDKMVQDINAKTSLIQQEDKQLELRLKQLDTEQNALATEIDAVSKVVKDNIEKSFKTFGG